PDDFGSIKTDALNSPADQVLQVSSFFVKEELKLVFVFYNKSLLEKVEINCLAKDLKNLLTLSTKEYEAVNLTKCL
ncbi:MAG: hypothetical protein AAF478_09170, partial [Pseudomonadota bacterium]